jgi:hypothetical protein
MLFTAPIIICILLVIFSGLQLQLLVKDHTELSRYQGPAIPAYRWDQFKVYGTMAIYILIIIFCVMQLYAVLAIANLFKQLPSFPSVPNLLTDENKQLVMDKIKALRASV